MLSRQAVPVPSTWVHKVSAVAPSWLQLVELKGTAARCWLCLSGAASGAHRSQGGFRDAVWV